MKNKRLLIETLLVILITIGGMLFMPQVKTLIALIPITYLLVERHLRHRPWVEIGFKRGFLQDLKANWVLFSLAAIIIQPLTFIFLRAFVPGYVDHVVGRLPFSVENLTTVLAILPLMAFSLLGEELTYRSLFQGRLTLFLGAPLAVLIASLLFALAHFSPGPTVIVAVDLGTIVLDSLLFGALYARIRNIWLVWAAHLLGDMAGLAAILFL